MANVTDWIGKSETKHDNISIVLVRRMAALLGHKPEFFPKVGEPLPHLWHWMFFQPELPPSELGLDGHPARGGFMPPADGRNRMWAGGAFEFDKPLIIGKDATCLSIIEKVVEKQGHTGSLLFVTVRHEYSQDDTHRFTERQTIVYREPSPPKTTSDPAPTPEWSSIRETNATLLFRYSAVTYNGHRIHYDYPYVTDTEGYDNLVVHGPMMATWALHRFIEEHPDKIVKKFDFRGMRPTTVPTPVEVAGRLSEVPNQAEVWITNDSGIIQKGNVEFI